MEPASSKQDEGESVPLNNIRTPSGFTLANPMQDILQVLLFQ
jgi:hypothetical protein